MHALHGSPTGNKERAWDGRPNYADRQAAAAGWQLSSSNKAGVWISPEPCRSNAFTHDTIGSGFCSAHCALPMQQPASSAAGLPDKNLAPLTDQTPLATSLPVCGSWLSRLCTTGAARHVFHHSVDRLCAMPDCNAFAVARTSTDPCRACWQLASRNGMGLTANV